MMMLTAYSTEHFRSDDSLRLMDETVAEVFGMMLGHETAAVPEQADAMTERRTAIVGLSGALRGCCEVRMNSMAARVVTSAMLGAPLVDAEDSSIGDAVGEICNMIAGGWKNRIPALASACALSPPTVISGSDYVVKLGTPSIKFVRTYLFGEQAMKITMQCEALPRG
jgi:chemotaxis protein CheX